MNWLISVAFVSVYLIANIIAIAIFVGCLTYLMVKIPANATSKERKSYISVKAKNWLLAIVYFGVVIISLIAFAYLLVFIKDAYLAFFGIRIEHFDPFVWIICGMFFLALLFIVLYNTSKESPHSKGISNEV